MIGAIGGLIVGFVAGMLVATSHYLDKLQALKSEIGHIREDGYWQGYGHGQESERLHLPEPRNMPR